MRELDAGVDAGDDAPGACRGWPDLVGLDFRDVPLDCLDARYCSGLSRGNRVNDFGKDGHDFGALCERAREGERALPDVNLVLDPEWRERHALASQVAAHAGLAAIGDRLQRFGDKSGDAMTPRATTRHSPRTDCKYRYFMIPPRVEVHPEWARVNANFADSGKRSAFEPCGVRSSFMQLSIPRVVEDGLPGTSRR